MRTTRGAGSFEPHFVVIATTASATSTFLESIRIASTPVRDDIETPRRIGKAGAYLGKSRFRIIRSPQHQGGWIEIDRGGEAPLRTWVVYPEAGKQRPAVVLIHGIRGLNDWTRAAALQVAASGYVGLAMRKLTGTQIHAAIDAVRRHALTISNGKTATIGFCWGGGESFRYAVNQPKLDAAIVFYGTSPETSTISRVDTRG